MKKKTKNKQTTTTKKQKKKKKKRKKEKQNKKKNKKKKNNNNQQKKKKKKKKKTRKKCYLHDNLSVQWQSLKTMDIVVYTKINCNVWAIIIVLSQTKLNSVTMDIFKMAGAFDKVV